MLNIGDTAPEFELSDQDGDVRTLSGFLTQGPVVLYFYPFDFSRVCTAQACAMRDRFDDATLNGVQIVGISAQSAASHKKFAAAHNLPFPLLADQRKTMIRSYGVAAIFGLATRRATFLIGTDGVIKNRVVADLFVGPHTEFLNAVFAENV